MNDAEVERLARLLENKLRRSFTEMVRSIRNENSLPELASKIANGDLTNLVEGVDVAVKTFSTEVTAGYVRAGQGAARWLNTKVPRPVRFNIAHEDSITWIEDTQREIAQSILAEQQQVARAVVAAGRMRGLSDMDIAEEVRDAIGLNTEQYKHVATYRNALEAGDYANARNRQLADARSARALEAAEEAGTYLGKERVRLMTRRYADGWVKFRANNVAITEANGATHAGMLQALDQAVANGDVPAHHLERMWITRGDHRVRGSHKFMHRQVRGMNDPFLSGLGNRLMYPGDPAAPSRDTIHCRCRLRIRYKGSRI